MALQILKELKAENIDTYSRIQCSGFLHDQKDHFCKQTIDIFDEYNFFDEFQYVRNKTKTWKLRKLITQVQDDFDRFNPNMILTFTDNNCAYQEALKQWKNKTKIVLFHEGYGDYSAPTNNYWYLYITLMVWPYRFIPNTRSYTGLYKYSFLLQPDIIHRNFPIKKVQIPTGFIKSIFFKPSILETEIDPGSIFLTLSGKDWVGNQKLHTYLQKCVKKLEITERRIYMKIAPNVDPKSYNFLSHKNGITLIEDPYSTSESYCYHPHFDYIVTDESSAVINAIYGGVQKTFFFLNEEIQKNGCYSYDDNDLITMLKDHNYINLVTIDEMVDLIKNNYSNTTFIDNIACLSVANELWNIMNE